MVLQKKEARKIAMQTRQSGLPIAAKWRIEKGEGNICLDPQCLRSRELGLGSPRRQQR